MTAETIRFSEWRPPSGVLKRVIYGARNVAELNHSEGIRLESPAFALFTGLMGDVRFADLPREKRSVIGEFFGQSLYYDRYLDLFVKGTQGKRDNQRFLEELWLLPRHLDKLKTKALSAGYTKEVINVIDSWFDTNRILNFALYQLAVHKEVAWKEFAENANDLPEAPVLHALETITHGVKDPVEMSIIIRSFSSISYAKSMLTFALDRPLTKKDSGLVKRIGAMIMICQAVDDLGSPSEDMKYSIGAMIYSAMDDPTPAQNNHLYISPSETEKLIRLGRDIVGGGLDCVGIDPNSQLKTKVAQNGLLLLFAPAVLYLNRKYGTHYPLIPTVKALWKELATSDDYQDRKYRQTTTQSLTYATEVLLEDR